MCCGKPFSMLYPAVVFESFILGAFFYAIIHYSYFIDENGYKEVSEGIPMTLAILVLVEIVGLVALGCLSVGHSQQKSIPLFCYLAWCVGFHLLGGPAIGSYSLYNSIQRRRNDAPGEANVVDNILYVELFFMVALVLQFLFGLFFLLAAIRCLKFIKRQKTMIFTTSDLRTRSVHHEPNEQNEYHDLFGSIESTSIDGIISGRTAIGHTNITNSSKNHGNNVHNGNHAQNGRQNYRRSEVTNQLETDAPMSEMVEGEQQVIVDGSVIRRIRSHDGILNERSRQPQRTETRRDTGYGSNVTAMTSGGNGNGMSWLHHQASIISDLANEHRTSGIVPMYRTDSDGHVRVSEIVQMERAISRRHESVLETTENYESDSSNIQGQQQDDQSDVVIRRSANLRHEHVDKSGALRPHTVVPLVGMVDVSAPAPNQRSTVRTSNVIQSHQSTGEIHRVPQLSPTGRNGETGQLSDTGDDDPRMQDKRARPAIIV